MSCCKCKYKHNIICGLCRLPFEISSNIEERIFELEKKIKDNKNDNHYYKLEIREMLEEMKNNELELKI